MQQGTGCASSAAGLRRFDVTAASLSSTSTLRPEQISVHVSKEAARFKEAEKTDESKRNRGMEICIMVSIATGILSVIGVVIAISPF